MRWPWVSITPPGTIWEKLPTKPSRFPALLDTGCNHNFSIRQEDLYAYAGLHTTHLPPAKRRKLRVNDVATPFYDADLWMYHNKPGTLEVLDDIEPFQLELDGGIGIYEPETVRADRPPLLGLQALTDAGCHLSIDCRLCLVTLRTSKPLIFF